MMKLEGMTRLRAATARQANDQMTKGRACFVIRHSCLVISLMLIAQTCCAAPTQAQSPTLVGRWKAEITFANADRRSLRFEAQGSGKGSFLLLDPRSSLAEPAAPSEAKWTQGNENSVTFSGAVEFPIGNVGRNAGTLVFKGKFQTNDSITGEVAFFPLDQDPNNPKARPSKNGTFTAIRATGR